MRKFNERQIFFKTLQFFTIMSNKSLSIKSYQTVDETSGEVLSIYRYLTGNPREYRFNGQVGKFYLDGNEIGAKLKMQPIAWRFFE